MLRVSQKPATRQDGDDDFPSNRESEDFATAAFAKLLRWDL